MHAFFSFQLSTFQAVVTTNGDISYSVFTYQCGNLNLNKPASTNLGSIGFSANNQFFANHDLSQTSQINDIACLNLPASNWSTVIYQISEGKCGERGGGCLKHACNECPWSVC